MFVRKVLPPTPVFFWVVTLGEYLPVVGYFINHPPIYPPAPRLGLEGAVGAQCPWVFLAEVCLPAVSFLTGI